MRIAKEDLVLVSGHPIVAGDAVLASIASANRDELVYDRGEEIDLHHTEKNQHVGFGYGAHHCLGAPLARWNCRWRWPAW